MFHMDENNDATTNLNGYVYTKILNDFQKHSSNELECSVQRLESILKKSNPNLWNENKRDFGNKFITESLDNLESSCSNKFFSCATKEITEEELKSLATPDSSNKSHYSNLLWENSKERIGIEAPSFKTSANVNQLFNSSTKNSINNFLTNTDTTTSKYNFFLSSNANSLSNEDNNKVNDDVKTQSLATFRTAREELLLQNIKKNGPNNSKKDNCSGSGLAVGASQQPLFNYGATKKTLGARRNVRSKFVPPIMNNKNSNEPLQNAEEQISVTPSPPEDERLANIDPKMIQLITNEIMHSYKSVDWNDIAGLEYPKSIIKEAVVYPLLRPDLFTGLRRPPRGILLFGPPGTGKTLIGKCIASKSKSTFFSISASSLTSKYVGESEKMVRALFAVAVVHQPSVIFIDEIDSMLSQRSESEHESTRRLKTEFLVQFDGVGSTTNDRILIVGATNRPQELDDAARRRFVKRLYIPLPEFEARLQILKNLLQTVKNSLNDANVKEISEKADGFSGADMESLCCEASMNPIRSIPEEQIPFLSEDAVRAVDLSDFEIALQKVRPSVAKKDLTQYVEWNLIYGAER